MAECIIQALHMFLVDDVVAKLVGVLYHMRHSRLHRGVLTQLLGIFFQISHAIAGGAHNRIAIIEIAHQPEGKIMGGIHLAAHQKLSATAGEITVVVRYLAHPFQQRQNRLHAVRQEQVHVAGDEQVDRIFFGSKVVHRRIIYYSSGANIGSQAGSIIGLLSNIFRYFSGIYLLSITTRNIYSLNHSLVMIRKPF